MNTYQGNSPDPIVMGRLRVSCTRPSTSLSYEALVLIYHTLMSVSTFGYNYIHNKVSLNLQIIVVEMSS